MERVDDLVIVNEILKKLTAEDIGRVACVCKRFNSFSSEESLWIHLCFRDLSLTQPFDHLGNPFPSFKEAYQAWREAFVMYPWPLVKRVKECWDTIKTWLSNNFPEAEDTLCKGASEAEIKKLESTLNVKLPLTTRIIYRFHNGQEIGTEEDMEDSTFYNSLGLIGGYSFYSHFVNVYLLPISQVIQETRIARQLGFLRTGKDVVVAASSTNIVKLFFLNCTNGQLYVGTRNLHRNGEMIPCVPHNLISLGHEVNSEKQQDAMLLWLEEHGRRLQHGFIKLLEEGNTRSINLFPEQPPPCSMAVTNGVQVRASALFIPELANPKHEVEKYLFAYSIRMSLEPRGCVINGMPFSSCQLHQRHWVICANDIVVSNFNGEAVIGMYPLLRPGDEEFVYQSCTPLATLSGSVEGSFTFVPGSLADPKGGPFEATVARFSLQVPDYVF